MDVPQNSNVGIFSESTLLPVSLSISIAIFAGWVATLQSLGSQNKEDVVHLRYEIANLRQQNAESQKKLAEQLLSIDTRLSYIQGYLKK